MPLPTSKLLARTVVTAAVGDNDLKRDASRQLLGEYTGQETGQVSHFVTTWNDDRDQQGVRPEKA